MFPLNDISLRCSLFVVLCTTALAAPGGFGSFAGSSAVAFSSANSHAQAGSVANAASSAHAVSSSNAFAGGLAHGGSISAANRDEVNQEGTHYPNVFIGTGSYVGSSNKKPGYDKFALTHHQVSFNTGNSNDNKSGTPCSLCQKKEDKLEKSEQWDSDEHSKETEEESEQEEESDESYDDGQYRPEHHYYENLHKKHKEQTDSGIHKLEDGHPYHYGQANTEGEHASLSPNKQENTNYNNYGNIGTTGGYSSKLSDNAGSTHSHPQGTSNYSPSWTNINKQKENGHINTGISGSAHTDAHAGAFVDAVPDKPHLDSASGSSVGCSTVKPGSSCGTNGVDISQGPIKLIESGPILTPNLPALEKDYLPNIDNVGTQNKPHFSNEQSIGQWPGSGNKPSLDQQSTGQWPGAGNKPSFDQQSTGQWPGSGNKPSFDQQSTGQWPGSGNKPSLDQQSTGQWPGAGNKPSFDQQSTGQWPGAGNKPSLDQQSTGQWPGAGNKPSLDQQSTGQWPGAGNKPSLDQQSTGQWPGSGNKPSLDQQSTGQWPGSGNKPSLDQQSTGQWPGAGNKPSSLNQPSTGHLGDHGSTNVPACTSEESSAPYPSGASILEKNLPIPSSGISSGVSYSDKNIAQQNIYGGTTVHSGTYYPGNHKDSQRPIGVPALSREQAGNTGGSFPHGLGTTGLPQNGNEIKKPVGSGNCDTSNGNPCSSSTGYPGSTITTGIHIGQNVPGKLDKENRDDGHVDKNIYKVNAENPFLFDVQGHVKPWIDTTSSPVQVPSHTEIIDSTSKPIGLGNPFLDGTLQLSDTYGTHNVNTDKNDHKKVETSTETSNKPIGVGNPFLMHGHVHGHGHGHGHNKGDSPIYNIGITIGGTPSTASTSTSTTPWVTTTVRPIGMDNPFFHPPKGSIMNQNSHDKNSGIIQGNKATVTVGEITHPVTPVQFTPKDKDFPTIGNAEMGTQPSDIYHNINSGVKGGVHPNKEFGSIANSDAGALATGHVDIPNITGANNGYNNAGHHGSSLAENANKPTNSFSNVPGSYDYKATPQTSGHDSSNNKGTSESNGLINGNNANNQYNPHATNGAALSFAAANAGANAGANVGGNAGGYAGSYSSSFSSSQASSSSFAASQSGSYSASGDLPGIMQQNKGTWPLDIPRSTNINNTWSNATSQASSFAANSSGRWSGSHPIDVKGR